MHWTPICITYYHSCCLFLFKFILLRYIKHYHSFCFLLKFVIFCLTTFLYFVLHCEHVKFINLISLIYEKVYYLPLTLCKCLLSQNESCNSFWLLCRYWYIIYFFNLCFAQLRVARPQQARDYQHLFLLKNDVFITIKNSLRISTSRVKHKFKFSRSFHYRTIFPLL